VPPWAASSRRGADDRHDLAPHHRHAQLLPYLPSLVADEPGRVPQAPQGQARVEGGYPRVRPGAGAGAGDREGPVDPAVAEQLAEEDRHHLLDRLHRDEALHGDDRGHARVGQAHRERGLHRGSRIPVALVAGPGALAGGQDDQPRLALQLGDAGREVLGQRDPGVAGRVLQDQRRSPAVAIPAVADQVEDVDTLAQGRDQCIERQRRSGPAARLDLDPVQGAADALDLPRVVDGREVHPGQRGGGGRRDGDQRPQLRPRPELDRLPVARDHETREQHDLGRCEQRPGPRVTEQLPAQALELLGRDVDAEDHAQAALRDLRRGLDLDEPLDDRVVGEQLRRQGLAVLGVPQLQLAQPAEHERRTGADRRHLGLAACIRVRQLDEVTVTVPVDRDLQREFRGVQFLPVPGFTFARSAKLATNVPRASRAQ
jgi:hypothetical protein